MNIEITEDYVNPWIHIPIVKLQDLQKLMQWANERRLGFVAKTEGYGYSFDIEAPSTIGGTDEILLSACGISNE